MVVAMIAVRMMQPSVDEIVDEIAVRDRRMAADRAVDVVQPRGRYARRPACSGFGLVALTSIARSSTTPPSWWCK